MPPFLFIPGPTPVADHLLSAMATPSIGHRTPEFSTLWSEVTEGVERLLNAERVFLFSNPATGVWEATLRNSVRKRSLHLVNGAFSAKWADVAAACGLPHDRLNVDWGAAIRPDEVDRALSSGKYDVVALVHNETSTGVVSPVGEIAGLMRDKYPDVMLHVDAVSSMTAVNIDVDGWGLGSCFASVQKAWGLPPGFTVCAVNADLLERSAKMSGKGYYFDMLEYDKYYQKRQTPSTPSLPHLVGLQQVLRDIDAEGLEARYLRHQQMAETARSWAVSRGQSLYPQAGAESVTLTAINNDRQWDIQKLYDSLDARGYRMDRGYGKLRGEVFRIAHMGSVQPTDLDNYLAAIDAEVGQ